MEYNEKMRIIFGVIFAWCLIGLIVLFILGQNDDYAEFLLLPFGALLLMLVISSIVFLVYSIKYAKKN